MPKGRGSRKVYHPDDHADILIAQARAALDLHSGDRSIYHTSWLASGTLGSPEWVSIVPGKGHTATHSFDRVLADGSNLLDEKNKLLLEAVQKSAILSRNGVSIKNHITPKRWKENLLITINFASWVAMHRDRFEPELYGFARITFEDYLSFLDDYARGGWTNALKCRERIIAHMHRHIEYSGPIEKLLSKPDQLDVDFVKKACAWLFENDLYTKSGKKITCVSRAYLYQKIGLPSTAGNTKLTSFLRQFEPHLQGSFLTASVPRGLPSHRSAYFVSDHDASESMSVRTFTQVLSAINDLFKCNSLVPEIIPNVNFNRKEALLRYKNSLMRGGHTRLIPLTIGMHALNKASQWILEFGPTIVEATCFYADRFLENPNSDHSWKIWSHRNAIFEKTIDNWLYHDFEKNAHVRLTDTLNITSLSKRQYYISNPQSTDFYRCMQSFIGACVLVIGLLKPMRDQEILFLPRNCLSTSQNGGSELTHEQMKAGILSINPDITRAIPSLTARAIQLLQVMGSKLKDIYQDDSELSDLLFYFPTRGLAKPGTPQGLRDRINHCLDEFCNMIDVPLDKEGRRWYIRIHEMRKFFILVSHRHGGDQLSQILRYQAGHKNKSHLESYIAPDAYDEEYVRYESECIDDKIIALEKGILTPDQNDGLVALYSAACEALSVNSISSVQPDEAVRILSNMRASGDYTVTTYSVTLENFEGCIETIDFAIRYGEKADAKFNKN